MTQTYRPRRWLYSRAETAKELADQINDAHSAGSYIDMVYLEPEPKKSVARRQIMRSPYSQMIVRFGDTVTVTNHRQVSMRGTWEFRMMCQRNGAEFVNLEIFK